MKRNLNRNLNRHLRRQEEAQLTIETALVFPIVLLILSGLFYMIMYVHDIVEVRSGAYRIGMEYSFGNIDEKDVENSIKGLPLFVATPKIKISKGLDSYEIAIDLQGKGNVNMINIIVNSGDRQIIHIPQTISKEVMYGSRVLLEELESKRGKK